MFSDPAYRDYIFYAHLLAQCRIELNDKLTGEDPAGSVPAATGLYFNHDHFVLMINPACFKTFSLKKQLGILKHEMLHILLNHVRRKKEHKAALFDYASDMAINQMINPRHLPDESPLPRHYALPDNLSTEQYYELLEQEGIERSNPEAKPSEGNHFRGIDDHSSWENTSGDNDIIREISKTMLKNAAQKAAGNTPKEIDQFLQILDPPSEITWRKVLRNILGNKKVHVKRTPLRADRRFPKRDDLRGKVRDRLFHLVVIADVSGSMSQNQVIKGLQEIRAICKHTRSTLKVLQVDTAVQDVSEFDSATVEFRRHGYGGTKLYTAIEYLHEHTIPYDCIVVITDGYHESLGDWIEPPKCKMLFLTTAGDIPGINEFRRYRQFELHAEVSQSRDSEVQ